MGRTAEDEVRADDSTGEQRARSLRRRTFLTRGGLLAGGAALGATASLAPASAQVTPQAVDFVYAPVGPVRVYDSRDGGGPLYNGDTQTLLTGLQTADPTPVAVTVNLTVTLTRQKGWLALYPGDSGFSGTSSVNWFGDFQDLANNAFVAIPADGSVNVTCGGIAGAQADFVIDLIGASVGLDIAAASVTDARAQVADFARSLGPWTQG